MENTKTKILVVDDDKSLLELLQDTLDAIGYDSVAAPDGFSALEELSKTDFDLVISDIRMPGMDGISLLKKIRRLYPNLPVLFITGFETPEIIGKATPDGLLAKPFRISHIEELIENTLAGREEMVKQKIKKVMVVDDDDSFREMIAETLRYHGYIPFALTSGKQALEELEKGSVDAVITDIKMPEMDGFALLKLIKEKHPDLPVILITGFFSSDDIEGSLEGSKPDGFLEKPFRIEKIINLLKQISPANTE